MWFDDAFKPKHIWYSVKNALKLQYKMPIVYILPLPVSKVFKVFRCINFLLVDFILEKYYSSKSKHPQLLQQRLPFFLAPAYCQPESCPPAVAGFESCAFTFFLLFASAELLLATASALNFALQLMSTTHLSLVAFLWMRPRVLYWTSAPLKDFGFSKIPSATAPCYQHKPSHAIYTTFLSSWSSLAQVQTG